MNPQTPPHTTSPWNRCTTISVILLSVYTVFVYQFSSCLTLNFEDWIHFSDFSFEESWAISQASYDKHNARIGKIGAYFVGPHALTIYHIIQPLFVLLACLAGQKLATGKWIAHSSSGLMINLLLMAGVPSIHAGVWWFIGNMNWFYPVTFALLFFALYDNIFQGNFKLSGTRLIIMLPMAFIIGMSNENTSITSVTVYIACGIYWIVIRKKKLT